MANSFSTTYPEIYSKVLLRNLDLNCVMMNVVNRDYEGEIKTMGDVVNAVLFGNVTISNYTEGSDVSVQNLTLTNNTIPIDQKKAFNGVLDLVEITQSHLPLLKGWMKRSAVAMGEAVDDRLLAHYADIDANNLIGSDGQPISITKDNVYDRFVEASEMLDADGVPSDERCAVIDEAVKSAVLRSPDYVKATSTGDDVVRKGRIGMLAGFDVYVSPRIANVSGVRNNLFLHKECISLALQIPPDYIKTYEPEKQFGTGLKGLALYGSKVFLPKAGVVLKRSVTV